MLGTTEVTIQVYGIVKQMTVFVVDKDAKYVLLGTDHKAVRSWVLGKGEQLSQPLGALTRAQSKVKQKQEMEDNKATVNSGATIKPLDKMSPPKEAESESVSGSIDSPPMEVRTSMSAEEEGSIEVEKGKDEEAKVLEPSDLEEEDSLAGDEGGNNSWLPTPSLVNSREEVASLVAHQQRDGSLKDSWRNAGKGEEGVLHEQRGVNSCEGYQLGQGTGKSCGAQTKKAALVRPWSQRVGGWSL